MMSYVCAGQITTVMQHRMSLCVHMYSQESGVLECFATTSIITVIYLFIDITVVILMLVVLIKNSKFPNRNYTVTLRRYTVRYLVTDREYDDLIEFI